MGTQPILRGAPRPAQPPSNTVVRLWGACPWSHAVTDYDRQNIYVYGRLLEGEGAEVPEREMARIIFGICADRHPFRALTVVRSHLSRAHWLKENHIPYLDW